MVSEGLEDMLASANRALKLNKISNIGFCVTLFFGLGFPVLLIVAAVFLALKIYVKIKGTIELDYSIDEDQQALIDEQMKPLIKITECEKIWRILQTSKVIDKKYDSGASNVVNRIACKVTTKAPFPFKSNLQVASFKAGKETLLFLPDKLFIIQGSKVGALNYSDITSNACITNFIESEGVPVDSKVVGQTWKYVDKSGEPDKRFKDNKKLPICRYGKLELSSASGLNTVLMFSNVDFMQSDK